MTTTITLELKLNGNNFKLGSFGSLEKYSPLRHEKIAFFEEVKITISPTGGGIQLAKKQVQDGPSVVVGLSMLS